MDRKIRSILVADNHDGLRSAMSDVLTREGYFVVQAANGAEVFAVLCCGVPNLLLLDLSMPHINGREVMHAVRIHHPQLQVVLVTADHNAASIAEQLGAGGHLVKPFRVTALLQVVAQQFALAAPESCGTTREMGLSATFR